MNTSRKFLLSLPVTKRQELADILKIRQEYLYQIGASIRNPSRELALRLEYLTKGKVKESDFDREIKQALDMDGGDA